MIRILLSQLIVLPHTATASLLSNRNQVSREKIKSLSWTQTNCNLPAGFTVCSHNASRPLGESGSVAMAIHLAHPLTDDGSTSQVVASLGSLLAEMYECVYLPQMRLLEPDSAVHTLLFQEKLSGEHCHLKGKDSIKLNSIYVINIIIF